MKSIRVQRLLAAVLGFGLMVGEAGAAPVFTIPVKPAAGSESPRATATPASPSSTTGKLPLSKYVKARIDSTLTVLEEKKDFDAAEQTLAEVFDQVVAFGKESDLDAFRQADFALRMVTQLKSVSSDKQAETLHFLRAKPELAHTLVFLISPKQKPAEVFGVLDQLREKRADQLDKYANLAAAICVVHARPFKRRINENTAKSAEPLEIFDYYVKNESKMFFGVKSIPAELLIWVVDTTGSIDEMEWALAKYGGDKEVGGRFFDIKYDYDHFEKGTPKTTSAGFTLQNILQYGGVCADQAYFAMEVGKSIGVPTAYTTGSSAETGHAWVGFLQAGKGSGWWNFDTGRYEAYRGVRGNVEDPQNREAIPDSQVSVLAELIGTKPADRQTAVALTDAAHRLIKQEKEKQPFTAAAFPAQTPVANVRPASRKAEAADSLALIELALKQCAGYSPAWFTVRDLAKDDKLTLKDKKHWADLLQRLGGPKYPDFTLSVLAPMIETITDHKEQNALWNAAFTMFQNRFDLAASIRMKQGAAWEAQSNTANAGQCYMDVIDRYANAGPFVIDALSKAEKLLVDSKRSDKVVTLYEQTWGKITPPREMNAQATAQSNWYRVGTLYAKKLTDAGKASEASTVTDQLRNPSSAKKPAASSKG